MKANESLWSLSATMPSFSPVPADAEVDVVVVGGGITGVTAARLLAEAGEQVALVEARTIGAGVSHRSTTQLTEAIDTRYFEIESDFGREGARLVASSSRAAIAEVQLLVGAHAIPCGYLARPGFLYTDREDQVAELEREHAAATRAGLAVELLARAPLPFENRRALRFPDQAQMHIQRYLAGLATAAQEKGALLYEASRVIAVDDGEPCEVHLAHGPVLRAKEVFLATHAPLNLVFLQTKIAAYRSYVLGYEDVALPDGLFFDMAEPYHYLSSFEIDGRSYLLVGGEDHKTGSTSDTESRFDALAAWTKVKLAVTNPLLRWSAQVEEPVDGLPFIGRNSASEHVYVATGFSGNGITFGTLSAMIVSDLVLGRPNPWTELYAATRIKPVASAATYVSENVDFPLHLVSDHLRPADAKSLDEVRPGEGKTVRVAGRRLAVYRDPEGKVHALSSVCTHLGCTVKWNPAERSWDCPCHGSRFGVDGAVLDGPAKLPLPKRDV